MDDDLYGPLRSQTRAKHDLLRSYLEPFAYKTLQVFGSLDFIDGFAGPWESADDRFADTSFGIAVRTLADVQARLAETGTRPPIRCLFNEADSTAFDRLDAFVEQARTDYPTIEFVAMHGRFAENADTLDEAANHAFRLVFIDPTGWTGYPQSALVRLLKGRKSEVVINFMSSFIDRFFRAPEDRRAKWLEELLGPKRAETLREQAAREEDVRRAIADMLKKDLGFRYICESPIAKNEADHIHFWLLYGTRNARGVEVLRDAEVTALTRHEAAREERRQGPQQLLDCLPVPGPYSTMRTKHLDELEALIADLARRTSTPVPFGNLATTIMTRRYVRKPEVKAAAVRLAKRGEIRPTWKERSARMKTPSDTDLIIPVDKT